MSGCLGPVAAALVDGELDHAAREKAHRHLAHCASCRAEVDVQRKLKSRLLGLDGPPPPDALTARLLGLSAPTPDVVLPARSPEPRRPAVAAPSAGVRPAARSGGTRGPAGRARALRRRAVAGTALAAFGVAAALALGGQPQRPPSTPVDPGTDVFVTEFVSTTNDGTGTGSTPDDRAGLTRAGLTGGGAGSDR